MSSQLSSRQNALVLQNNNARHLKFLFTILCIAGYFTATVPGLYDFSTNIRASSGKTYVQILKLKPGPNMTPVVTHPIHIQVSVK